MVRTQAASTDSTTTELAIPEAEAKQLVASMNLRLTDFPSSWRAEPPQENEGCGGIQKLTERYDVLAKEDSKDFAKGDSPEASSSAVPEP